MSVEYPLDAVPEAWRELLTNMLPPQEILANARRGTADPEWRRISSAAYPDSIALSALAYEPELKLAIRQAGIAPGMRVFDAACGPGVVSRFLLDSGADEVIGFDISPTMLALAVGGPPAAPGKRLLFQQGDLRELLPFPDAYFDAVWLGDLLLIDALPELRRVTRPGGSIIVKYGGLAPGLTYSWDCAFEERVRAAANRGYALNPLYGESDMGAFYGAFSYVAAARFWTVFVERIAPAPPLFELALTQNFGQWEGAFIKDAATAEDWARLERLYDAGSPDYLFRRPDARFTRTFTIFRSIVG